MAVDRAWALWKPRAGLTAGAGVSYGPSFDADTGAIANKVRYGYDLTVSVSQPLFVGPAIPRLKAAYTAVQRGQITLDQTRRDLLFAVAETYYGALGLQRISEVARNQVEITRQHEQVAKARFEAGDQPKVAVVRAEIARLQAEQDVRTAENALDAARGGLGCLTGRRPDMALVDPPPQGAPGKTEDLLAAALKDRPDLRGAKLDRDAAQLDLDAAWYQFLPSLSVSGRANPSTLGFLAGLNLGATVGLDFDLYSASRYADLKEAQSRLRESEIALSSRLAKIRDEVRRAALDLDTARSNLVKAEEQERLARENHGLVRAQFEAGLSTQVEVADAQAALFTAEVGAVRARLDVELAAIRVARTAGQFNP